MLGVIFNNVASNEASSWASGDGRRPTGLLNGYLITRRANSMSGGRRLAEQKSGSFAMLAAPHLWHRKFPRWRLGPAGAASGWLTT